MSVIRITLGDLEDFHQKVRRMMDEVFVKPLFAPGQAWCPPVDIYETEDSVILVAELAGVKPEDISVTLDRTIIRVVGSRAESMPPQGRVRFHQMEIERGQFERFFRLPCPVDDQGAQASYQDGWLRIVLPKMEPVTRTVPIET
jgi:HSP20 family protein